MKKILIAVFLGNVIIYAWFQLEGWSEQTHQVQPPLQAEKIQMQDPLKGESLNISKSPTMVESPASTVPPSDLKLSMNMSAPPVLKETEQGCMEWGDFSGPELERVMLVLSGLQLGDKVTKKIVEHDTGYWVFIPPLKSKNAVNNKIRELRDLGIKDYFVVSAEGRWRNAISLGVFKSREAAKNLFNQLRAKGVRSAKIGERASKIKSTRFILSGLNAEKKIKLVGIQKDFSGSEMSNIQCTLTR